MENKIVEELWHSKCERDSKNRHFWQKLGVIEESAGDVNLIWRCSQCQKCISEPLLFLEIEEESFRLSEEQEKARKVINYFFKQVKDHTKISRKKFYSILQQVYYLAKDELKNKKSKT